MGAEKAVPRGRSRWFFAQLSVDEMLEADRETAPAPEETTESVGLEPNLGKHPFQGMRREEVEMAWGFPQGPKWAEEPGIDAIDIGRSNYQEAVRSQYTSDLGQASLGIWEMFYNVPESNHIEVLVWEARLL